MADFECAVVNGFVGTELALARAGACGRLRENQLPENVGEGCVADAPGFELRMEIGVEQPAVVAGDAERFVLALVGAVDEIEQPEQLVIEAGERVVGVESSVAQSLHQASERKFVEVTAVGTRAVRFDRQQTTALGVEDEKQAIEERERVAVNFGEVGFCQVIVFEIGKSSADIFKHAENELAKIAFEIALEPQRLLADFVQEAGAVLAALES
ncbi:MAG: hypothetical protein ABSD57_06220 [Verrucomicrobiota bacterium]